MQTRQVDERALWRPRGWPYIVGSGLLLGFSFPPYPLPVLAWVAFVPLLWRWQEISSTRRIGVEAFVASLIACGMAFHWVLFHVEVATTLASLGGLVLMAFFWSLPWVAADWIRRRTSLGWGLVGLVSGYLTLELFLSIGEWALPWALIGHTQATAFPFNQVADLIGTPGLSLWVWGLNLTAFGLLHAWLPASPSRTIRAGAIASILLLVGAPLAYNAWLTSDSPPSSASTEALLVQPGTPPTDWADLHDDRRIDRLIALSDSALAHDDASPDLIIWPETALPVFSSPEERRSLYSRLQNWTERQDVTLLTGANVPIDPRNEEALFFNSAFLFAPGAAPQQYDKIHLVPFAERVPLVDRFSALRALSVPAGGIASYQPGHEVRALKTTDFTLGPQICFESVFGRHAARYADGSSSADFLVTLSHDGWWGPTIGHRQHLDFTRLRAIETRRPLAMVTVSGTTALLEPSGRSVLEIGWMESTAQRVSLPHAGGTTFYAQHGEWMSIIPVAVFIALLGSGVLRSPRRSQPDHQQQRRLGDMLPIRES